MLQTFKCCGYCRVLKNVENVARINKKKKFITMLQILQFVADVAELFTKRGLPNVAKSLKNVTNDAQPTKIV